MLQSLLADEQVADAPVLVLGNKIDKPGAASEDELRHIFNLHGQTTGRVRTVIIAKAFSLKKGPGDHQKYCKPR